MTATGATGVVVNGVLSADTFSALGAISAAGLISAPSISSNPGGQITAGGTLVSVGAYTANGGIVCNGDLSMRKTDSLYIQGAQTKAPITVCGTASFNAASTTSAVSLAALPTGTTYTYYACVTEGTTPAWTAGTTFSVGAQGATGFTITSSTPAVTGNYVQYIAFAVPVGG